MPPAPNAPPSPRPRAFPAALAWAVVVLAAYLASRAHLLDGLFPR